MSSFLRFYLFIYIFFCYCACRNSLWLSSELREKNMVMFWCVKEGRVPKWVRCHREKIAPKMSTLLCHPLEIDCVTSKKVAPRIYRGVLFPERRRWGQSFSCFLPVCWSSPLSLSLSLSLSFSVRDHNQKTWSNLWETSILCPFTRRTSESPTP